MTNNNLINFMVGISLGMLGLTFYNSDLVLYCSVFCPLTIVIYVLINFKFPGEK